MKNKIFLFIVLLISFFTINVEASTNTYERTNDNLLVPDYIDVTDYNKSNILLTPAVDSNEKIYDFAELFSASQEQSLYNSIDNFIKDTNLDLAIVTISYNNKHSSRIYAEDFYDYNSFGIDTKHSGLLFLIDMETREIYVSTTGDAIDIYSQSRINNILDNVYQYMSDEDYYTGCSKFIEFSLQYNKMKHSEDSNYTIKNGQIVRSYKKIYIVIFIVFLVTIIALLVMIRMNHLVFKANSSRSYLRKDTQMINKVGDVFIGSHINKTRIDNDNSSFNGGGSFGSSGISHGGGGHRF